MFWAGYLSSLFLDYGNGQLFTFVNIAFCALLFKFDVVGQGIKYGGRAVEL